MNNFTKNLLHYYGDFVRKIFLLCAGILIVATPFYPDILPFNPLLLVLFILGIGVMAGLTSPDKPWVIKVDTVLAGASFVIFELSAFSHFNQIEGVNTSFLICQSIALLFFFALYFSAKTWRGSGGQ